MAGNPRRHGCWTTCPLTWPITRTDSLCLSERKNLNVFFHGLVQQFSPKQQCRCCNLGDRCKKNLSVCATLVYCLLPFLDNVDLMYRLLNSEWRAWLLPLFMTADEGLSGVACKILVHIKETYSLLRTLDDRGLTVGSFVYETLSSIHQRSITPEISHKYRSKFLLAFLKRIVTSLRDHFTPKQREQEMSHVVYNIAWVLATVEDFLLFGGEQNRMIITIRVDWENKQFLDYAVIDQACSVACVALSCCNPQWMKHARFQDLNRLSRFFVVLKDLMKSLLDLYTQAEASQSALEVAASISPVASATSKVSAEISAKTVWAKFEKCLVAVLRIQETCWQPLSMREFSDTIRQIAIVFSKQTQGTRTTLQMVSTYATELCKRGAPLAEIEAAAEAAAAHQAAAARRLTFQHCLAVTPQA